MNTTGRHTQGFRQEFLHIVGVSDASIQVLDFMVLVFVYRDQ